MATAAMMWLRRAWRQGDLAVVFMIFLMTLLMVAVCVLGVFGL